MLQRTRTVKRDTHRDSIISRLQRIERLLSQHLDEITRHRTHARGLRWLTAGLRPQEALFGLGEHFGALNRRGQAFASWNVDAFGVRSDRAYKNVPLLLSSLGYAAFFDMTAPLYYDLGQVSVAAWQVTARADHLRVYLIVGEGIAPLINGYHQLTGAPAAQAPAQSSSAPA